MPFSTREYWESRLQDHFDLEGVGYLKLGKRFNRWMYRVRGDVFERAVDGLVQHERGGAPIGKVLDIGAGTGFYVDRWLRRGAEVTGVDLTSVAVSKLGARFPGTRFVQADIGQPLSAPLADELGTFDFVSAFDVLFHIVDDGLYQRALHNVAALLRPGGWFLWSDNFIHQPTIRVAHQVSRSLREVTDAVTAAGLEVVDRRPMFVLMNYPADTSSKLARWGWAAMVAPAMASDWLGGVLGALLYPIERRLVGGVKESPSTELMICRRLH